ncbi:MAG TPA: redoxin family protein, partial [Blastocatellia bacterium]
DAPVTKKKKIPPAAKFLVLLAAVVGIGLLLQLARPRSAPRHDDENDFEVKVEAEHETGPALGTKLPLPDENWAANGQTLVIVMSVGCDFCEAMAPFYKELTDKLIGRKNLHIVALLPQAVEESKPFLADQGLNISDVKQVTLKSISVTGTPTVLLVDKTGVVTNIWVGTLSERQKDGLTAALAVNRTK